MALQLKMLVAKPGDLSLVHRTHTEEREQTSIPSSKLSSTRGRFPSSTISVK